MCTAGRGVFFAPTLPSPCRPAAALVGLVPQRPHVHGGQELVLAAEVLVAVLARVALAHGAHEELELARARHPCLGVLALALGRLRAAPLRSGPGEVEVDAHAA